MLSNDRPRTIDLRSTAPQPLGSQPFTSIDLFAGAGGLTLGLRDAGLDSVLGSDNWAPAVATFRSNMKRTPMLQVDARDLTSESILKAARLIGPPDLMVGGPPCQGFSSAGARAEADPRNTLVGVFASLVAEVRPRFAVFENVEGFLTADGGRYVHALLQPLIEAGYTVSVQKLNVANFGVPQLRKRVVVLASIYGDPGPVMPLHHAWSSPGSHRATEGRDLPRTPTVNDVLEGLPLPSYDCGELTEHSLPAMSDLDLQRMQQLLPGQKMKDLPAELQHASFQRRANRRVADGTPSEKRGGAPAGIRRLRGDEPSRAITSAASREFIHPSQDRPLTLRECARLQTFPDDYVFCGTMSERQTLIGNAVPPRFAYELAIHAAKHLVQHPTDPPAQAKGNLVRFEVTNASAMSPSLSAVVKTVLGRYPREDQPLLWS